MANPGCPDGVLQINGENTDMMVRVGAIEHFENFVSVNQNVFRSVICNHYLLQLALSFRCATQFCLLKEKKSKLSNLRAAAFQFLNGALTKSL